MNRTQENITDGFTIGHAMGTIETLIKKCGREMEKVNFAA